jgi:aspartyl-tRNA(Asn)/glutamyl-tRNA(Gln) amidotransferase subunit B
MEKGDMRLEPNISLSKDPKVLPKYKVEVKNINSFRFVERAIQYEIKRQTEILEKDKLPLQETRGWDEDKALTFSQRVKEEANDYRYFPEPDIPPIRFTQEQISKLKSQMPELRDEKITRFVKNFDIPEYDADILTREKSMADYFEKAVDEGKKNNISPKQISNTIINKKLDPTVTSQTNLIQSIMSSTQTVQVDEHELQSIINSVLKDNSKAVEDYKNGKESVIMFLLGQVMRAIGKRVDPQLVKEKLQSSLA